MELVTLISFFVSVKNISLGEKRGVKISTFVFFYSLSCDSVLVSKREFIVLKKLYFPFGMIEGIGFP